MKSTKLQPRNILVPYQTSPTRLLFLVLASVFVFFSTIDFINLFLNFYPRYVTADWNGAADLVYFTGLGQNVLSGNFTYFYEGQFDGGPLAPVLYAIPVFFSISFTS